MFKDANKVQVEGSNGIQYLRFILNVTRQLDIICIPGLVHKMDILMQSTQVAHMLTKIDQNPVLNMNNGIIQIFINNVRSEAG